MAEVNEWNETLFGCCDDCGICCYGYCCGPCLFASNAKTLDNSNFCVSCCTFCILTNFYQHWLLHYFKRQKLRQIYGLREDPVCSDVAATFCCSSCALCQEAREMKSRRHTWQKARSTVYQPTTATISSQPQYASHYPPGVYESHVL